MKDIYQEERSEGMFCVHMACSILRWTCSQSNMEPLKSCCSHRLGWPGFLSLSLATKKCWWILVSIRSSRIEFVLQFFVPASDNLVSLKFRAVSVLEFYSRWWTHSLAILNLLRFLASLSQFLLQISFALYQDASFSLFKLAALIRSKL